MKTKILKVARLYILPAIMGIMVIILETHIFDMFFPIKCYAVDFVC